MAKKCLLPPFEVRIWFEHLEQIQKNRKRGAEKAAETRRRKKAAAMQAAMQAAKQAAPEQSDEADEETFCGVCEQLYAELTEENENWIQCDICPTWYHFECVGIHTTSLPENYVFLCKDCSNR